MKICRQCNKEFEEGAFCPLCGNKLEDVDTYMYEAESEPITDTEHTPVQQTGKDIDEIEKPSAMKFLIIGAAVLGIALIAGFAIHMHSKKVDANPTISDIQNMVASDDEKESEATEQAAASDEDESEAAQAVASEEAVEPEAEDAAAETEPADTSGEVMEETETSEEESYKEAPAVGMSKVRYVSASSILKPDAAGYTYVPENIMDNDLSTGWVEGVSGQGEGELIHFAFDDVYKVSGFMIYAGYHKNEDKYYKNSRPRSITLEFSDGSSQDFSLEDIMKAQDISLDPAVETEYVDIIINSVYPGTKWEDTVISEVDFY